MLNYLAERMKAIIGAIITGLGTLSVAYSDDHISNQEWITVAIATLTALGGVWAVANKDSEVVARAKAMYAERTTRRG